MIFLKMILDIKSFIIPKRLSISSSDSCVNMLPCGVMSVKSQSSFSNCFANVIICQHILNIFNTDTKSAVQAILNLKRKGRCINIWYIQQFFPFKSLAGMTLMAQKRTIQQLLLSVTAASLLIRLHHLSGRKGHLFWYLNSRGPSS